MDHLTACSIPSKWLPADSVDDAGDNDTDAVIGRISSATPATAIQALKVLLVPRCCMCILIIVDRIHFISAM